MLRKFYRLALTGVCLFFLLAFVGCQPEILEQRKNFDRTEMLRNIAEKIIQTSHAQFEEESSTLRLQLQAFVSNPDITTLTAARQQWIFTAEAWKRCELFDLGEVKETFIHNKIETTPANTEFIESFIRGQDSISEAYIDSRGSASKGLKAIEYLLFNDEPSAVVDSFTLSTTYFRRGLYLQALGDNLHTRAKELMDFWDAEKGDYITRFSESEGNSLSSSISLLVNEMITLLEKMVQTRLGKPLGKDTGNAPDSLLTESWRSGISLQQLTINLTSLRNTYEGNLTTGEENLGLDDYLNVLKARYEGLPLPDKISAQFDRSETALAAINGSLETALIAEPEKVENLYQELRTLLILFKADVANNLAITITFNDNDGD